jgi:Anti-sigma factor NepR
MMITGSAYRRTAYVRTAAEGCRTGRERLDRGIVLRAMTRKDRHPGSPGPTRRRGAPRGRAAVAAERREVEEIHAFLTGRTNGGSLLHALYDHVLDEPIPSRLRTLLKK